MKLSSRMRFLMKNGLSGIAWLAVLLAAYLSFEKFVMAKDPELWMETFYARPGMVYLIYLASEFFFGLFPPEIFMIWAVKKADVSHYILNLAFFGITSYLLGYVTFLIGRFLHKRVTFRFIRIRFLKTLWPQLKKYGIFLIVVAALTPLPWSATCRSE